MKRVVLFLMSGGGGFVVDALVLSLLIAYTPLGPYLSRAVAIVAAMTFTFFFNRSFTFGRSSRTMLSEGLRYATVGAVTAMVNYGLYSALLLSITDLQPLAALVFASLAAMALSFFGYSKLVFARR